MFEGVTNSLKSYSGSISNSASNLSNKVENSIFSLRGNMEAFRVSHSANPGDITYAVQKDDDTWSKEYTNAYSKGMVNSLDSTGDDKVTSDDYVFNTYLKGLNTHNESAEEIFEKFDANDNGEFDAKDNAALMYIQDETSDIKGQQGDGIVTPSELEAGTDYVNNDENGAAKLKEAYEKNVGL